MLGTGLAQLRFAASLIFGFPFSTWALDKLVDAALRTHAEFGSLGSGAGELTGGPELDDETRREFQARRFRAVLKRATSDTAYYGSWLPGLGIDLQHLGFEDIVSIPITPKSALRDDPDAFVRRTARPVLQAMTTGTTGRPTYVQFSARELQVMVALSALGFLYEGTLEPDGVVHIGTSGRAVLGNLGLAGACARIGATAYLAGVIDPAETLAMLAERRALPGKKRRASVLSVYASYLGQLVETGLRLGYRPDDFGVERVLVGGEVVTDGLEDRARRLFGDVDFRENYALTETLPFGGTECEQRHLHFEPSHGLAEVRDPRTGAPASPAAVGTLVLTPFPPFRETTLLVRYDTEDIVRSLAGPLTCRLRQLPATGRVDGKLRLAVQHENGWVTPRQLLEALECIDAVPLPARCSMRPVHGGVDVEVCVRNSTPAVCRLVRESLEAHAVPVIDLRLVEDPRLLSKPLPCRADLREVRFDHEADATPASSLHEVAA
jgi:phenylacetate-coenzyme A ligase PaaK-like adenylate-forming protein